MTDAQGDVAVDRGGEPVETDSGHSVSPANVQNSPALDRHAAVSGDLAGADHTDVDLAEDVRAISAPHDPAATVAGTSSQVDQAGGVQGDPNRVDHDLVPANSIDPASDRQSHPNQDERVPADPAAVRADPAQVDPAREGQVDVAQDLPVTGPPDPTPGDPAATTPVSTASPLRDPDEAALRLAEAAVFASATPMTPRALSQILPDDLDAAAVIAALTARYAGRGLELCEIGGGLQFRTAADLAPQLRKVVQVPRRLPRVALETLAIVAYHQPITRPEIEDLRGTGLSQQTLDVLLENDLIVARGRKETPGRPTLWGTTAKFLEYFGLRDIRELPRRQDLLLEAVRPDAAAETDSVPPEGTQP